MKSSIVITTPKSRKRSQSKSISNLMANNKRGSLQLWQFLLRLLESKPNNGDIIEWTRRSSAEFKLLNPEEVARLWGISKNRPTMNYDKLSRSLRYYYERGIMEKVAGERYVYRFINHSDLFELGNSSTQEISQFNGQYQPFESTARKDKHETGSKAANHRVTQKSSTKIKSIVKSEQPHHSEFVRSHHQKGEYENFAEQRLTTDPHSELVTANNPNGTSITINNLNYAINNTNYVFAANNGSYDTRSTAYYNSGVYQPMSAMDDYVNEDHLACPSPPQPLSLPSINITSTPAYYHPASSDYYHNNCNPSSDSSRYYDENNHHYYYGNNNSSSNYYDDYQATRTSMYGGETHRDYVAYGDMNSKANTNCFNGYNLLPYQPTCSNGNTTSSSNKFNSSISLSPSSSTSSSSSFSSFSSTSVSSMNNNNNKNSMSSYCQGSTAPPANGYFHV